MLSHELRNPLAAIKNAVAVLHLPAVTDELAARAQAIIRRQTAHLRDMVDEILDLSRAMSGKIQLSRQPLDLSSLVASCIEKFVASDRTAYHRLTLNLASVWVDGDSARLLQIVEHLLENALKYTPAGGSIVIDTYEDQGEAVLTVTDTGVGIPAELVPSIFDVFAQGAVALDRSHGGLGIGLAIVQRLVGLHDGLVSVHSEGVGRGAMFAVRMPVAIAAAQEGQAPVSNQDIAARSN
jgi:signal transduction histidine kinase